jgi:lipoate-protein ligase B
MHGFAVNITKELSPFKKIIPCGISDAEMTSIHHESGTVINVRDFSKVVFESLEDELIKLAN